MSRNCLFFAALFTGFAAHSAAAQSIIGTVERFDPRFDLLVPKDAQLEKIAEGFIWTEGAVWYKPGKCLLFSDIPNNVVIKWQEGQGTSEFLKPSGYTGTEPRGGKPGDEPGSNGLFVDSQGRLHLCEHGDRRVTRIEKDGTKTVLADNYMGKRLNSPNDLAIHPSGDVFFTDPPYGLAKGAKRELDFTGVYRISAADRKVSLVSKDLSPNGIALVAGRQETLRNQSRFLDGVSRERGRHDRRRQRLRRHQEMDRLRRGRRLGRPEMRRPR